MNNNKILGKRFIKVEEYFIHKAELDLKKHQWKRIKNLNGELLDAVEDFEKAYAQRDYVDLLISRGLDTPSFNSYIIGQDMSGQQIKVFKKCPNQTQAWTLQQAYFQKLRMLIHNRTKPPEKDDMHQETELQSPNMNGEQEEEFEIDVKCIIVQKLDKEIKFLVLMANGDSQLESDFEDLVTKYPRKVCRALVKDLYV